MATGTAIAQATAYSAATTGAYERSREQIELDALGTREFLATNATATAIGLSARNDIGASKRVSWFWPIFAIVFLSGAALLIYGGYRILIRNSRTVRDADGSVISYYGQVFLPESIAPPLLDTGGDNGGEFATVNTRNGRQGFDKYRQPFKLTGIDGNLIYEFNGRQLDKMQINIQNGDIGFRRDTSSAGMGMDEVIGKNRVAFSQILEAVKVRGWVIGQGAGHVWTEKGMREMLKMNSVPHSLPHS